MFSILDFFCIVNYNRSGNGLTLMTQITRVQVIEGSLLDEAGLRALIRECDDFELVQHARCGPGCRLNCIDDSPDVVIMEVSPNGHKCIDCVRQIRGRHPEIQILSICSAGDPSVCKMMMDAGAIGFVSKQVPPRMFIEAIRQVARGKPFVESWVAKRMIEGYRAKEEPSPFDLLSNRENVILQLMLSGQSNKSIAKKLHISISTLGNHRAHIKSKLGATNQVDLIKLAISHGVV